MRFHEERGVFNRGERFGYYGADLFHQLGSDDQLMARMDFGCAMVTGLGFTVEANKSRALGAFALVVTVNILGISIFHCIYEYAMVTRFTFPKNVTKPGVNFLQMVTQRRAGMSFPHMEA